MLNKMIATLGVMALAACAQAPDRPQPSVSVAREANPNTPPGPDWKLISTGNAVVFGHPETAEKTSAGFAMWVIMNSVPGEGLTPGSKRTQIEFSCAPRRMRYLSIAQFTRFNAQGAMTARMDRPSDWEPVPPGTMWSPYWSVFCDDVTTVRQRIDSGTMR